MLRRWGPMLMLMLVLVLTLGLAGVPRAHAAPDLASAWQAAGCPAGYEYDPVNGLESTVTGVADRAGGFMRLQWRALVMPPTGFSIDVVNEDCQTVASTAYTPTGIGVEQAGAVVLRLPPSANWIVIHHTGVVGARFALS